MLSKLKIATMRTLVRMAPKGLCGASGNKENLMDPVRRVLKFLKCAVKKKIFVAFLRRISATQTDFSILRICCVARIG